MSFSYDSITLQKFGQLLEDFALVEPVTASGLSDDFTRACAEVEIDGQLCVLFLRDQLQRHTHAWSARWQTRCQATDGVWCSKKMLAKMHAELAAIEASHTPAAKPSTSGRALLSRRSTPTPPPQAATSPPMRSSASARRQSRARSSASKRAAAPDVDDGSTCCSGVALTTKRHARHHPAAASATA